MQPEGFSFGSAPPTGFTFTIDPAADWSAPRTFTFGSAVSGAAIPKPAPLWKAALKSLDDEERVLAIQRYYYANNSDDMIKLWDTYFETLGDGNKANIVDIAYCARLARRFETIRKSLYSALREVSSSAASMKRMAKAEKALIRIERAFNEAGADENWRRRLVLVLRTTNWHSLPLAPIFPRLTGSGDASYDRKEFQKIRIGLQQQLSLALQAVSEDIKLESNEIKAASVDAREALRFVNLGDDFTDQSPDAAPREIRVAPFSF